MSEAYTLALAVVMELPETERRALADAVYDSLLTPEEDAALFAELERRRADYEAGRTKGVDGEEFFRLLREKK